MFERFREPARQAIVLAQDEARRLGHPTLGTEHLLLGLLGLDAGITTNALAEMGCTSDDVRLRVVQIVGEGTGSPSDQLPFTYAAKETLEQAGREATASGHTTVGPEHILLALAAEEEGVAAEIFLEQGIDRDQIVDGLARAQQS